MVIYSFVPNKQNCFRLLFALTITAQSAVTLAAGIGIPTAPAVVQPDGSFLGTAYSHISSVGYGEQIDSDYRYGFGDNYLSASGQLGGIQARGPSSSAVISGQQFQRSNFTHTMFDELLFDDPSSNSSVNLLINFKLDSKFTSNSGVDGSASRLAIGYGAIGSAEAPPDSRFYWEVDIVNFANLMFQEILRTGTGGYYADISFIPACDTGTSSGGGCYISKYPFDLNILVNMPVNTPLGLFFEHRGSAVGSSLGASTVSSSSSFSISVLPSSPNVVFKSASGIDYSKIAAPIPEPNVWAFMVSGFILITACMRWTRKLEGSLFNGRFAA